MPQTALTKVVSQVKKNDFLIRASDLLVAVVDYAVSPAGGDAAMEAVTKALGPEYVSPFVEHLSGDREAASHFGLAIGTFLGSKSAIAAATAAGIEKGLIDKCLVDYVTSLNRMLHEVAHDANGDDVDGEDDQASTVFSQSVLGDVSSPLNRVEAPLSPPPGPNMSSGNLSLSGAEPAASQGQAPVAVSPSVSGYIPTVSGIAASMPLGSAAIQTASDEHLGRLLSGLSAFLAHDDNRATFCKQLLPAVSRGPSVLTALLDRKAHLPVQLMYQAVFCLWLLSFPKKLPEEFKSSVQAERGDSEKEDLEEEEGELSDAAIIASAMEDAGTPLHLTSVLREVHAEKVVRISLATLRNLMLMSTKLRKEMVSARLVPALESLCFRRWNDEDITEDLRVLADALASELESMTTFDVYRHEVLSGALDWTPAHRDENFWRENVEKLDGNNLEVLRCMVRLLNDSSDPKVLSVACHDLAQFIKHHPRGRFIAQSLGVKGRLMELMADGDGEVRRYALTTVQVLLISNWSLMQRVA